MNGQLTVVERRADPVVGLAVTSLGEEGAKAVPGKTCRQPDTSFLKPGALDART
jgi:hypothetical protein